ncbi:MAG: response regulator [Vicinamibacterales bacterium]
MTPLASREKTLIVRANSRGRVLIVDDEPLIRWSLAAALRVAGFEVATAMGRGEALSLASATAAPDAVLIDLEMYNTNCLDLVDEFLAIAPACRVVALTTCGPEVTVRSRWSAIPHIRKPFDLAEVVAVIERELAPVLR